MCKIDTRGIFIFFYFTERKDLNDVVKEDLKKRKEKMERS